MNNEDPAPEPSEGNGANPKSNKGCGGCLLPLIIIVLTVYCSFDKSDFYLIPGEANLWSDAMEEVFDNLDQIVPDSLEVDDPLDVFDHTDKYINKGNIIYGVHPFLKLRSKEDPNREYLMRVLGIVQHTGPDEFDIRTLELDTLINFQEARRLKALEEAK